MTHLAPALPLRPVWRCLPSLPLGFTALVAAAMQAGGWLPILREPALLLPLFGLWLMLLAAVLISALGGRRGRGEVLVATILAVLLPWMALAAPLLGSRPEVAWRLHNAAFAAWAAAPDGAPPLDGWPVSRAGHDRAVEFVVGGDYYLPLVYEPEGRHDSLRDLCAAGGTVVRRLSREWAVCRRDMN
ncbi:MAG TPA: hypothetical protein VEH84_07955 [Alphaproteobacteria bacterium]|nr:hypothetical protein [Alphaproteobacteria bacterium]